ncbi:MAG: LapA family protein [Candidatus Omnitrophota bacterium]
MMKKVFGFLLILIVIVFIAQNYQMIEIKFLTWKFLVSRALVIFLALFVGIILGWLFGCQKKG